MQHTSPIFTQDGSHLHRFAFLSASEIVHTARMWRNEIEQPSTAELDFSQASDELRAAIRSLEIRLEPYILNGEALDPRYVKVSVVEYASHKHYLLRWADLITGCEKTKSSNIKRGGEEEHKLAVDVARSLEDELWSELVGRPDVQRRDIARELADARNEVFSALGFSGQSAHEVAYKLGANTLRAVELLAACRDQQTRELYLKLDSALRIETRGLGAISADEASRLEEECLWEAEEAWRKACSGAKRTNSLDVGEDGEKEPPALDGPIDGDSFAWKGTVYRGLTQVPYRLLEYLYAKRRWTASYSELAEPVWRDKEATVTSNRVGSARKNANKFFVKNALPLEVTASDVNQTVRLNLTEQ